MLTDDVHSETSDPLNANADETDTLLSPTKVPQYTSQPILKKPLPGLKLPKSQTAWSEANLYFATESKLYDEVQNIDDYTETLQSTIYTYFAQNFGQIIRPRDQPNHDNLSVKELKKKLATEKRDNPANGDTISALSKENS